MASGLYKTFKSKCLDSSGPDLTSVTVKVSLVRTSAYTVNLTTDDFFNDVPSTVATATLGSKTITTPEGGVFDAADSTFTSVTAGAAIDALVVYYDTGTPSTSLLVAYIDGFSVTPNGGDITIVWAGDPNRIFKL